MVLLPPVKTICGGSDDNNDNDDNDDYDCTSTKTAGSSSSGTSSGHSAVSLSSSSSSAAGTARDHGEKDQQQQQHHEEEEEENDEAELVRLLEIVGRLQPLLPWSSSSSWSSSPTTTKRRKYPPERRTIVITGANSGIGLAAAKLIWLLANQNHHHHYHHHHDDEEEERSYRCGIYLYRLVLVCRSQAKGDWAAEQVRRIGTLFHNQNRPSQQQQPQQQHVIIPLACDQSSLDDVYRFNERIRVALSPHLSIDVLCLNAAILASPDDRPLFTRDGLEQTLQVNYLATALLSHLLLDLVTTSAPAPGRIIFTTSGLHETTPLNNLDGIRHQLSLVSPPSSWSMQQQQQQIQQQQQKDPIYERPQQQSEHAHYHHHNHHSLQLQRPPLRMFGHNDDWAMPDGSPYQYKRAYALSKTLLVRHCAELQRRCCCCCCCCRQRRRCRRRQERTNYHHHYSSNNDNDQPDNDQPDNDHDHVIVNCFSPGLMLDTGLFRHQSEDGAMVKLRQHNPHAMANAKSVYWGAGALVYMALAAAAAEATTEPHLTTKPTMAVDCTSHDCDPITTTTTAAAAGGGQYWSDRDSQLGDDAIYGLHFRAVSILTTDPSRCCSSNTCTGTAAAADGGSGTAMDDEESPATVTDAELWNLTMELIRQCRRCHSPIAPWLSQPLPRSRPETQQEHVVFANGCYAATIG